MLDTPLERLFKTVLAREVERRIRRGYDGLPVLIQPGDPAGERFGVIDADAPSAGGSLQNAREGGVCITGNGNAAAHRFKIGA